MPVSIISTGSRVLGTEVVSQGPVEGKSFNKLNNMSIPSHQHAEGHCRIDVATCTGMTDLCKA